MEIKHNGRMYAFRNCDTVGLTVEQLQKMADDTGRMQYEPGAAWLVVRGVGYGWEVTP